MKWDQQRPAKAAVERCQGFFKALDILPTGACFFSLLTYPPTRAQWGARAGGLWGGFPNPAKLICMGFAKNGLASSQPRGTAGRAPAALPSCPPPRTRPPGLPGRPTLYLPTHLPYTSPATTPPTLPTDLPYTSQVTYPIPLPPLHLLLSQPTYPIPLLTHLPYTS
jgi:hypothetical protein